MCRAADSESKGKVKNAVRYVKHGFLENRFYPFDDETLNSCAIVWLERTSNAKLHGTTRKIPAEGFKEERDHLKPITVNENIAVLPVRSLEFNFHIISNENVYVGATNVSPAVPQKVKIAMYLRDGKPVPYKN